MAIGGRSAAILGANVRQAIHSLAAARQRTVLGIVGIVIGIGSIIAMISLGLVAKAEALKEFEALGTDVFMVRAVRAPSTGTLGKIPLRLATGLAAEVPSIMQASPRLSAAKQLAFAGRKIGEGKVDGVTSSFADILKLEIEDGRFISDLDGRTNFCAVGADIASAMRRVGAKQVVGEAIKLGQRRCNVVGVLASKPKSGALSIEIDVNRTVFVSIENAQRVLVERELRAVVARSHPNVHYTAATRHILSYFERGGRGLKVAVDSATELIVQMEKQMQLLTLLLGTIGSISLIVGGIGIMNIMIVSVAERKREIGLRRALGARRRDIQGQFLIEAIILCVLGGILGTAVGLGTTYAACRFSEWEFSLSGVSILLGIGVASAVGLFFGFQPAYQAARLDPIAALHGE